ncbi:hypothetical protein [Winogradskyella forsetii]|uniref:hypothetical protein n=1 Tax=Winogradskyella forsetii TaxID=2686077 RepID=UPI0015BECFB9|nr:hypothetical protein [Winogradskyella forsetii]
MNLIKKHSILILTFMLLTACAMDNKNMKSSESSDEVVALEDEDIIVDDDAKSAINLSLINQKLQDFYDLIALKNQHPEFTNEVTEQLKNYTKDSINNYIDDDASVIKDIRQSGKATQVNDSTQKMKLIYNREIENTVISDTIYAIITHKIIKIDNESLVSKKVHFSKD